MKDEIKEILNRVKKHYVLDEIQDILLLDYITNLQEENERLKKALCKDNIVSKCKYDYLKRQKEELELNLFCIKDYKSRNEKAIEYINQNKHLSMFADCREPEEDWNYDLEINPRELLNILQGVGKDE